MQFLIPLSASPICIYIYILDSDLVITAPADDLAPNDARSSAGTVLAGKLDRFSFKLPWLSMIMWHNYGPVTSSKVDEKAHDALHDNVIKWKHFPHYWPFVGGIHRSPMNFPHKGQWRRALMFPLICAWTNNWVNSWDTGDLRCHWVHYDVTVMESVTIVDRVIMRSGAHFMNNWFIVIIQIQWKYNFVPIQDVLKWLLNNFAHGTTDVLLWHVQIFFSNMVPCKRVTHKKQISIKFELWWNNHCSIIIQIWWKFVFFVFMFVFVKWAPHCILGLLGLWSINPYFDIHSHLWHQ